MEFTDISPNSRKIISDELRYVVQKMRDEEDPLLKLFYYSGAYGIFPRVFNLEYHPLLVHIHMILQISHNTINNKINEIIKGIEQVIKIPPNFFEKLEDAVEELAEKMEKYQDVSPTLQKITNITYVMIGNGYYLLQKGVKIL